MEYPTTQPQLDHLVDSQQFDHLDALLPILADPERRRIITHLQTTPADKVALEELTTHLTTDTEHDPEQTSIRLHHTHLPTLDETGILDYNPRTNTIEYHGHLELETLLEAIQTHHAP